MPPPPFVPSPDLDAVLIDLDNTLSPTDHLRWVRTRGDRSQLTPHLPGLRAYPGVNEVLAELSRTLPLGVVSRTHTWYVEDVLSHLFPHVRWATFVSYDDVQRQKPYPDSLVLAAQRMGLQDRSRVAYLGDAKSDLEAAYHAGMRPVLCTWEPSVVGTSAAHLIPDAILPRPTDMLAYAADPDAFLPHLEARHRGRAAPAGTRRFVSDVAGRGTPLQISVLGRYFADDGPTRHLHERHPLSRWMETKEAPGQFQIPGLVSAVAEAVAAITAEQGIGTVTAIPAKPGRTPRMEQLLSALEQHFRAVGGPPLRFRTDLLGFAEDAQTIKHFSRARRAAEVERSLHGRGPCVGERVLILDDVLTSGTTFRRAHELLSAAGAVYVAGLALAKTISGFALDVDPTYRSCPECGRQVKLIRTRFGTRFWGCVGYWEPDQCGYTQNA